MKVSLTDRGAVTRRLGAVGVCLILAACGPQGDSPAVSANGSQSASIPAASPAPGRGCEITSGTYRSPFTDRPDQSVKVFVPPDADRQSPMIVSLHPALGTSESQEITSRFTEYAARAGAIAVYPQAGPEANNTMWVASPKSPDLDFVARVVETMHQGGCSQPDRTYLNGMSMGAMVTSRLICERPELFAGASMVAGVLMPEPGCRIPSDMPIVVVHGRNDRLIRFDGSMPKSFEIFVGPGYTSKRNRAQITRAWAEAKGCDARPRRTSGKRVVIDYSCPGSLTKIMVNPGGHSWDVSRSSEKTSRLIWKSMLGNDAS